MKMAQVQLSKPRLAQIVSLENTNAIATSMNVITEAVLMDKTNTTTLQAAEMMIIPNLFVSSVDFRAARARVALSAIVACSNCSSVLVGSLPAGPLQLDAGVVLRPSTSGNLFSNHSVATIGGSDTLNESSLIHIQLNPRTETHETAFRSLSVLRIHRSMECELLHNPRDAGPFASHYPEKSKKMVQVCRCVSTESRP